MSNEAFDLAAKLKLDSSKLDSGLNQAAAKFETFAKRIQQAIGAVGSGQQGGFGLFLKSIIAAGELTKRSFGGDSLTALRTYKAELEKINKELGNTASNHQKIARAMAKQFNTTGAAGGGMSGVRGFAKRAADTLMAVGELTKRAFGVDAVGAANRYTSAVQKLNQELSQTLNITRKIAATPLQPGANVNPSDSSSTSSSKNSGTRAATTAVRGLTAAYHAATRAVGAFGTAAVRIMQTAKGAIDTVTKAAAGLATGIGAAIVTMTRLASDANEAASKFSFVFKEAADKTGESMDAFSKAAGRSRYEMRSMAADIGALIGPMGFTKQKTGELSVAVSKLAVDLSSFFNVSESDALIALRAAIVGEQEPMRRLGVTINEVKIQQEAFRLGLIKNKNELDSASKAQAILSIIFRETSQAQGDAIRTGDQLANSWRRMTSFVKDAATDLGQVFVPAVTKYVRSAGDIAVKVAAWAKANQSLLTQKLDVFLSKVEVAASKLGQAFVSVWNNSGPIIDVFQGIYDKAVQLYQGFMAWFETLPKGTQDALKVAAAMTALGVGLEKIGGSIPIVGQFAQSLGQLLNPLNAVQGAFSALLPLVGAGGSLVAAFVSGGAGLAAAIVSFVAATGPLGILIAVLTGAVAAGGAFAVFHDGTVKLGDLVKNSLGSAFEAARLAAKGLFDLLKGDGEAATSQFQKATENLVQALENVGLVKGGTAAKMQAKRINQEAASAYDKKRRADFLDKYGPEGMQIFEEHQAAQKRIQRAQAGVETAKKGYGYTQLGEASSDYQDAIKELSAAKSQLEMFQKQDAPTLARLEAEGPKRAAAARQRKYDEAATKDSFEKNKSRIAEEERLRMQAREQWKQQNAGKVAQSNAAIVNAAQGQAAASDGTYAPTFEPMARRGVIGHAAMSDAQAKQYAQALGIGFATTGGKGFADFVSTGQGDIAGALKRNKTTGVIDDTAALRIAANYRDVLKQMDGVSKEGVDKWYADMTAAIARVKNSPNGLEDFFKTAIDKADVKLSKLLDKAGKFKPDIIAEQVQDRQKAKEKQDAQNATAAASLDQNIKGYIDNLGVTTDENGKPVKDLRQAQLAQNKLAKAGSLYARNAKKGLRANAPDASNAAEMGANNAVMQYIGKFAEMMAQSSERASQLKGQEQADELARMGKLKAAVDALTNAFKGGERDVKKLGEIAKKTGVDLDKLAKAEEEKALNAQGKLSPRQQQAQQQAQQAAQQMAQGIQQALGMANDQSKAIWQGVFGGAEEVQQMIDQAVGTGNMKAATDLIRSRLEAQLKQSTLNLHFLGTSSMIGNTGSVDNSAYQMSKGTPIANMIEYLQSQLAKLPKMAEGGIVSQSTQAIVGENGPEAIIPLNRLGQFMNSVFGPVSANMLKTFDNAFRHASYNLSAALDSHVPGAQQMLNRWYTVQDRASKALDYLYRSRQIDLSPNQHDAFGYFDINHRRAYAPGSQPAVYGYGMPSGNVVINASFHGVDISNEGQLQTVASKLYKHLSNEARSRGRDLSGRDPLRSPMNCGPTILNSPTSLRR